MTEDRIRESLNAAVEEITPNMLDGLMAELGITGEPKALMQDAVAGDSADVNAVESKWIPRKAAAGPGRTHWGRAITGLAAAFVLVLAGLSVINSGKTPFAMVSMDVNPGIEITIDSKERVLDAKPINNEASEVLGAMDLKGSNIDVACNAIVGSMLTHGYLSDLSNSILLSVSAEDEQTGAAIEKRLSENINAYLEKTEIAGAILGQYVNNDESVRTFADQNGISLGKAWLIKNLLNTGSTKMTEDSLLKLSTQELIVLGQKRGVENQTSYGDAESGKYIGSDKAVAIALEKAGVSKADTRNLKYEFDCEDGVLVYEVSFYAGDYEYDYDINAINGSVVSYEKEYEGPSRASGSSNSGNTSGGSSGGNSGNSSGSNNSKSNNAPGGSGTVRSGDDVYKVENGTVYEYDDDDNTWEPEHDKKIENGKVYEKDDGKWEREDDDYDDDDDHDDHDDHDDDDDDDDDD